MEIRNNAEILKNLLGVSTTAAQPEAEKSSGKSQADGLSGDKATVSALGAEAAQAASGSEIRPEKVAAIQSALASGSYQVAASAVAGKVVESMLARGASASS